MNSSGFKFIVLAAALLFGAFAGNLVVLYFTQFMPSDRSVIGRFQTLVYQTIVD
jgi:hypothetical protein